VAGLVISAAVLALVSFCLAGGIWVPTQDMVWAMN
jgi:hypothetical protein